jgi:hypothetical protein
MSADKTACREQGKSLYGSRLNARDMDGADIRIGATVMIIGDNTKYRVAEVGPDWVRLQDGQKIIDEEVKVIKA